MTRDDLISMERHYAALLRREAGRRRKRYPAVSEQLTRWAEAADLRVEALRFGPLFDQQESAA